MTTFNLSGAGKTTAKTKPDHSDDFYVTKGRELDLTNKGVATVHIGVTADGIAYAGDHDTFNLVGKPGSSTTIYEGQVVPTSGTINLDDANLTIYEWSHTSWNNTGTSVFAHGSTATMGGVTNGTIRVESGSSIETGFNTAHMVLNGGTFIQDGVWSSNDFAQDVTFAKQTAAQAKENPDTLILRNTVGADHWTMSKSDLLQVFGADGTELGSANLHNNTGKPLQVDQLAGQGVVIIADATPRPGMIVHAA